MLNLENRGNYGSERPKINFYQPQKDDRNLSRVDFILGVWRNATH
jgi:hypothetical protein